MIRQEVALLEMTPETVAKAEQVAQVMSHALDMVETICGLPPGGYPIVSPELANFRRHMADASTAATEHLARSQRKPGLANGCEKRHASAPAYGSSEPCRG